LGEVLPSGPANAGKFKQREGRRRQAAFETQRGRHCPRCADHAEDWAHCYRRAAGRRCQRLQDEWAEIDQYLQYRIKHLLPFFGGRKAADITTTDITRYIVRRQAGASQEAIAKDRKTQVGTGERSEKIRTYNFPQSRITDHRINFTTHQLVDVLEGDLGELLDQVTAFYNAEKLKEATQVESAQ